MKIIFACAGKDCIHIFGCMIDGLHTECERCSKNQFYQCTLEKDMIQAGDINGEIFHPVFKQPCKFCPPPDAEKIVEPIAFMSEDYG
jgi:hypothetical protein